MNDEIVLDEPTLALFALIFLASLAFLHTIGFYAFKDHLLAHSCAQLFCFVVLAACGVKFWWYDGLSSELSEMPGPSRQYAGGTLLAALQFVFQSFGCTASRVVCV